MPDHAAMKQGQSARVPVDKLSNRKWTLSILLCVVLGALWVFYPQGTGQAQEEPGYVGSEVCATCHAGVSETWALTAHRRTLFNEDPSRRGCESCHGPGGPHVAAGGDPTKIVALGDLKPDQLSETCLKCHTQENVTLWHTGLHARAKLSCTQCHDPHQPGAQTLLADMEEAKTSLEGLARSIKQAELAANLLPTGSEERTAAGEEIDQLRENRNQLRERLKGVETVYQRTAEPYLCYNCHKTQQVQGRMASHHPIQEGKVKCSSCHNPHGGPRARGMLREDSVNETCFRCHAEKVGPFVFEHVPVTEDCTTCHNPHGSPQNNLLVQSQPFLCLKCHAGPHSRGNALGTTANFARYYTECTDCHNQIHGSDARFSLRF